VQHACKKAIDFTDFAVYVGWEAAVLGARSPAALRRCSFSLLLLNRQRYRPRREYVHARSRSMPGVDGGVKAATICFQPSAGRAAGALKGEVGQ